MNDLTQLPPHDLAAEQAVLGSMMLSADALADGLQALTSGEFFRPAHQLVFEAVRGMSDRGEPVDAVTVAAELERTGQLSKVGNAAYLHTLIASVPTVANAGWYAAKVHDLAGQRNIGEASETIRQIAQQPGLDLGDRVDAAYRTLDEATSDNTAQAGQSVADLFGPTLDAIESGAWTQRGICTGWRDFDAVIPRFRPGQLITFGARPAQGKSLVMHNIAMHVGVQLGVPVLFRSLEMSEDEFMVRTIAAAAEVDMGRLQGESPLTEQDWGRITKAAPRITEAQNVILNCDTRLSVAGLRSELRSMARAGTPAGLVIIDYLQLMTSPRRGENRQVEVSDFSRALKLFAKTEQVPVIVGSQLNRGPEMRADKRPMLADLRESGSVEQDSDVVVLLYRDDQYFQDSPSAGEIELIVAKNRQGRSGITVPLAFRGQYAKCGDLYRDTPEVTQRTWGDQAA